MIHQMHMFEGEEYFGDLYVNSDSMSYTAIVNEPNVKKLFDWWEDNLYGTFEVVDMDQREGKTCYLLHTK